MNTLTALLMLIAKSGLMAFFIIAILLFAVLTFTSSTIVSLFVFLVENWIVQTAVAAWVAFRIQQAVSFSARKNQLLETSYQRKIDAAKSLYALVDKRIHASRVYLATIESEPAAILEVRKEYAKIVAEWNAESKAHQVTLLIELPPWFGLQLDNFYNPHFLKIENLLRKQRLMRQENKPSNPTYSQKIRNLLRSINQERIDDMREILKRARRDREIIDQKVKVSPENSHLLSHWQIIKAIFKPII